MKIIPFEKLYSTDFIISEPMAKYQYWASKGNVYNAIGKPKVSHTLLWFKNCSAIITDKDGDIITAKQDQLIYTAKGTEYKVEFQNTNQNKEDTVVIHFQLTDINGEEICPTLKPTVCMKSTDLAFAILMDKMSEEFKNNVVCVPELKASIYKIISIICQKHKNRIANRKFSCIREGIRLLEQNDDISISEISKKCGVSECYFRRLFKEYSGESPMDFRQKYRIEKAKQLLLSDEYLSVEEIAEELNFSDIYHFSKTFKKYCGLSPHQFFKAFANMNQ